MYRTLLAAALLLFLPLSGAQAHAFLLSASPAAGDILTAPPDKLVLTFSGPVTADELKILVVTRDGRRVASSADKGFAVGWADATLPLGTLAPGGYTVTWDVNPRPGHGTHGQYTFEVSP